MLKVSCKNDIYFYDTFLYNELKMNQEFQTILRRLVLVSLSLLVEVFYEALLN